MGRRPAGSRAPNVIGSPTAAAEWHVPEGTETGDFDSFLLIFNPTGAAVTADVIVYIEKLGRFTAPAALRPVIPAEPRLTINMKDFLTQMEEAGGFAPGTLAEHVVLDEGRGPRTAKASSSSTRSTARSTAPTAGALAARRSACHDRYQEACRAGRCRELAARPHGAVRIVRFRVCTRMLLARILFLRRFVARAVACDCWRVRVDRRRPRLRHGSSRPPQQPRPQAPPPIAARPTPLPQAQQDALVQRAREALKAGRAANAIELSDNVLSGAPDNQAAIGVKLDAMIALGDLRGALRAYDGFVSATGRDYAAVLAPIARAQLKALTQSTLIAVKVDALEALAAHGDAEAKTTLQTLMKDDNAGRPAAEALARLGDKAAAQRVVQLASQAQGGQRADAIADARDDQGCAGRGARARGAEGQRSGAAGGRRRCGGGARDEDAAAGAAADGGQRASRRGNIARRSRSSRSATARAASASPKRSPATSPTRACPRRRRCARAATSRGSRA